MIDGQKNFYQPIKNDQITYDNIPKIANENSDYYRTGCFLDYPYFKKYYKVNAINLSKQQKLDVDPKAIQQNRFTENLDRNGNKQVFFIIKGEKKKANLHFFKRNSKSITILLCLNIILT